MGFRERFIFTFSQGLFNKNEKNIFCFRNISRIFRAFNWILMLPFILVEYKKPSACKLRCWNTFLNKSYPRMEFQFDIDFLIFFSRPTKYLHKKQKKLLNYVCVPNFNRPPLLIKSIENKKNRILVYLSICVYFFISWVTNF